VFFCAWMLLFLILVVCLVCGVWVYGLGVGGLITIDCCVGCGLIVLVRYCWVGLLLLVYCGVCGVLCVCFDW